MRQAPLSHPSAPSAGVNLDRRLKLELHRSRLTFDAGLFPYRELDNALVLTERAASVLSDARRGKNTRHLLAPYLLESPVRQSVFRRLVGTNVNDAGRLSLDASLRSVVERQGGDQWVASTGHTERLETEGLATGNNLPARADLAGAWID